MKRRGNLRTKLPLLLARGAVVLTIGWVIFLGVAAAAGLTRILPIGTHREHVAASHPAASASTSGASSLQRSQGGDLGRSQPTHLPPGFGGNAQKPPIHA